MSLAWGGQERILELELSFRGQSMNWWTEQGGLHTEGSREPDCSSTEGHGESQEPWLGGGVRLQQQQVDQRSWRECCQWWRPNLRPRSLDPGGCQWGICGRF